MLSDAMTNQQMADVYDAAADYIEVHGWAVGETMTATGEVCMSGAIGVSLDPEMVTPNGMHFTDISDVAWNTWFKLDAKLSDVKLDGRAVSEWNDEFAGDQYEVINMLRDMAKDLRNAE